MPDLISIADDGRVWAVLDDVGSFIRDATGRWAAAAPPSADDLKDN